MARVPAKKDDDAAAQTIQIRRARLVPFRLWVLGTTPLITHSWSEKAKREMLGTQLKVIRGGKAARDPNQDYVDSLYQMGDGVYGFPATGLKKAILAPAHKDRGIARSSTQQALWIHHEMVRVQPAFAGAICDMPLIRIIGAKPEMREDMGRVGVGLSKKATLLYRAQFWPWAFYVTGQINQDVISLDTLATLIYEAGLICGIGEWRNEKNGIFGAFKVANEEESQAWDRYRSGDGPLPEPPVDDGLAEAAD